MFGVEGFGFRLFEFWVLALEFRALGGWFLYRLLWSESGKGVVDERNFDSSCS